MAKKNKSYHHFTLDNGIEVLFYPIKEVRAVNYIFGLPYGSAFEKKKNTGTLHFLEHTIFQGCKRYNSSYEIAVKKEELGINNRASVGLLDSSYEFKVPDNNLKAAMEFSVDLLSTPVVSEESVENSRKVILTEQKSFWDVPENNFYHFYLKKFLDEDHVYNRRGFGYSQVVRDVNRDQIVDTYEKFYKTQSFKLAVVGNVTENRLRKILSKTVEKWISKGDLPKKPKIKKPTQDKFFAVYNQPRKQVNFRLIFPMFGTKEDVKRRITVHFVDYMLGSSLTSLLFQRVREELGLVYSIWTSRSLWPELGMFFVGGTTDLENINQVMNETSKVIRQVLKNGFDGEHFRRAVNFVNTQSLINFTGIDNISDHFMSLMLDGRKIRLPEDYNEIADSITINEVNNMAREILDYNKIGIALMGDKEKIDRERIEKPFVV